jgi:hypothetical protein
MSPFFWPAFHVQRQLLLPALGLEGLYLLGFELSELGLVLRIHAPAASRTTKVLNFRLTASRAVNFAQ